MNKKSYLRINSKQEAEIFFFSSIFLHFNFKNIAKKRKRNKCYESVTASVEDTKGEAGSPDVPGHRPGRDMVVGHGLGHWPRCSTQGHLTGADNAWARPPHNWQTKSGSECEKWVMATQMRLSPWPPRWAATNGEATGRTPRSLLAVLLRKSGSTHQPVSLAAVTCRRWKPLSAHSPADTCHCSHAPPKATLLLAQLRLSHPSPCLPPRCPGPTRPHQHLRVITSFLWVPFSISHPQTSHTEQRSGLGQGTQGWAGLDPTKPYVALCFVSRKAKGRGGGGGVSTGALMSLVSFQTIRVFPQRSNSPDAFGFRERAQPGSCKKGRWAPTSTLGRVARRTHALCECKQRCAQQPRSNRALSRSSPLVIITIFAHKKISGLFKQCLNDSLPQRIKLPFIAYSSY